MEKQHLMFVKEEEEVLLWLVGKVSPLHPSSPPLPSLHLPLVLISCHVRGWKSSSCYDWYSFIHSCQRDSNLLHEQQRCLSLLLLFFSLPLHSSHLLFDRLLFNSLTLERPLNNFNLNITLQSLKSFIVFVLEGHQLFKHFAMVLQKLLITLNQPFTTSSLMVFQVIQPLITWKPSLKIVHNLKEIL